MEFEYGGQTLKVRVTEHDGNPFFTRFWLVKEYQGHDPVEIDITELLTVSGGRFGVEQHLTKLVRDQSKG